MPNTLSTRIATLTDLAPARVSKAMYARFSNGVNEAWHNGYLVGWIHCDQPWVCGRFEDTDHLIEECDFYQYCEVYEVVNEGG